MFHLVSNNNSYDSFIYPHLLHGNIFWGSVAKHDYESLFRFQKRTVRLLTKSSEYSHTDPTFEQSEFLKLDSIMKLEMCKIIHRDFFITNFFDLTSKSDVHSYNTIFNSGIALTTVRTTTATNFFFIKRCTDVQ